MPELPEVETIKKDLAGVIVGKKIKKIMADTPKMVQPSLTTFNQRIIGRQIKEIDRRAKMLIWRLSDDLDLLFHLKMTGQLVYRPKKGKLVVGGHPFGYEGRALPNEFTHVIFEFSDGGMLYFNDLRKFGWVKISNRQATAKLIADKYGVEPLTKDFTLDYLRGRLTLKKRLKIKQVLADQKFIAGLGNIYVDEACFVARVKPDRKVGSLNNREIKALHLAIQSVLKKSIKARGTSFNTYVDAGGRPGNFVKYLNVYKREGQKCKRNDGGVIKRVVINGRGTRFCSKCQK